MAFRAMVGEGIACSHTFNGDLEPTGRHDCCRAMSGNPRDVGRHTIPDWRGGIRERSNCNPYTVRRRIRAIGGEMPRNVRNFWIDARIDGRSARLEGGPQAKDGGFSLVIRQRDNGGIVTALHVDGRVLSDGRICLDVQAEQAEGTIGGATFRVLTSR